MIANDDSNESHPQPLSALGQSRRFVQATSTSASPSIPDVFWRRSERTLRAQAV